MSKSYGNNSLYIRQRDGDNGIWSNWIRLLNENDLTWSSISNRPTTLSQFTNDSGYITSSGSCSYATSAGRANSVAWSNVSGRPTKVSQFTNDSGYITSSASISGNAATSTLATYVKDSYNGKSINITYGKDGQGSTNYLASWNGYELGAISPANINAGSATKLQTTRSIWGCPFDGTGDINGLFVSGDVHIGYGNEIWCTDNLVINYNNRGSKNVYIFNGNLGIGNMSASEKLSVTGNILATGGITAYSSSDIRLKQDLRKLDYFGIIKAMGGTFGFAWKKDNTRSIGWIAQHVLCNPHLKDIVEIDEKGYYKINYWSPKLIATAFGAIEQVGDEVSRLKARVVFLESEVQRLSGEQDGSNNKRLGNKNINSLN